MAEQVGRIAVELRQQLDQRALAAGVAVAADKAAGRGRGRRRYRTTGDADAGARLRDKRAVLLEQIVAGEGATQRVTAAPCVRARAGGRTCESDQAAVEDVGAADIAEERRVGDAVEVQIAADAGTGRIDVGRHEGIVLTVGLAA